MNACNRIHEYLDGSIVGSDRIRFETHLSDCRVCAGKVAHWRAFEKAVRQDASDIACRPDTAEQFFRQQVESAFVQNAAHSGWRMGLSRPVLIGAAVTACVVLFFGLFLGFSDLPTTETDDSTLASIPITRFFVNGSEAKTTTVPGESIVTGVDEKVLVFLTDDRVAVGRNSQMTVKNSAIASTQLALLHGWFACSVSKRHGVERFFADTADGRFRIAVKGTRFAVQYTCDELAAGELVPLFQVAVTDGVVEVTERKSRKWTLRADEQLVIYTDGTATVEAISASNRTVVRQLLKPEVDDAAIHVASQSEGKKPEADAKTEPSDTAPVEPVSEMELSSARKRERTKPSASAGDAAVSLAQIKQWIGMGRYKEAISALESRLKTANSDSESWRLLAECRRKTGNYQGALTAYQQVVAYASVPVANAARYKMGLIYQDHLNRPADAIVHFSKYLAGESQLLRAEALYHLGKAEYSVGKKTQAKTHLNEVVNNHGATAAAVKARRLLQKMGPADPQQ
ncbi:MAG: tetratricopeptide repeat protein [Deltaproteobacteria bacterium]|nr:tetratricopeptide repeat protein [Deltaproteobacteria bacterium]MBN2670681.1 tetratricopeptide repeat protein [Deltaproteobacteria bacterium]